MDDLGTIEIMLKTYAGQQFVVNQLLQSTNHYILVLLTPKSSSDFKKELFGYMLDYTKDLIDALVAARDPEVDPTAKNLNEVIKNHTTGPFNDGRVG